MFGIRHFQLISYTEVHFLKLEVRFHNIALCPVTFLCVCFSNWIEEGNCFETRLLLHIGCVCSMNATFLTFRELCRSSPALNSCNCARFIPKNSSHWVSSQLFYHSQEGRKGGDRPWGWTAGQWQRLTSVVWKKTTSLVSWAEAEEAFRAFSGIKVPVK